MSAAIADCLLALIVLVAWVGAFGFARLTSALDRLHCISFIYFGCGLPLALLSFVTDGASTRSWKVAIVVAVVLIAGASINQAVARAVFMRDEAGERS